MTVHVNGVDVDVPAVPAIRRRDARKVLAILSPEQRQVFVDLGLSIRQQAYVVLEVHGTEVAT